VIETSNNLSTWPEAIDVTHLLTEGVEFSHAVNLSGTERKFLRLRINQIE
jgi:hypothetical protein